MSAGKDVGQKAKDVSGIAKLKMDIRSKEDFVEKQYAELGKAYYEKHKDEENAETEEKTPEDVEGFIRHRGKNCLCTGYWKVYADKERKLRLFEKYEYAKENLIQLLHYGLKMTEIIEICGSTAA
jgi:hypothetical protein